MDSILNALSSIGDFFVSVGNAITALLTFIGNILLNITSVLSAIMETAFSIPVWLTWMPVGLLSIVAIGITIVVVSRIIGWY